MVKSYWEKVFEKFCNVVLRCVVEWYQNDRHDGNALCEKKDMKRESSIEKQFSAATTTTTLR